MSQSVKALREDRAKLANEIQVFADLANERPFNAEEEANWKKLNEDFDSLSKRITSLEAVLKRASDINDELAKPVGDGQLGRNPPKTGEPEPENRAPKATEEQRALALQAWVCRQLNDGWDLSDEHREACQLVGVNPNSRDYRIDLVSDYRKVRAVEQRALSGINDTAGGYLVPEGFIANVERSMLAFGGVRNVATVMRTSSGEDMNWPTTDDTSNKGAIIQENVAVSEQDVTFGQVTFRAYNYSSKLVRVPVTLMQDSAIDLASLLGSMLGERLARIHADHFTTGTGSSQPKGIITAASSGKTAASATAIAADELFDLLHSVDPAYRTGPGVGWMMHDNIVLAIRKLKDGNGQYLWQPGLTMGSPDRILGYPITVNQSMASSVASGAKTVLFGMLSKYVIRDVLGIRLRRLVERYADQDQEGFVAFMRTDGNLLDAGTDPVKFLTQA